ncbi:MAG: TraB/GumN family protein [Paludibacter sp.]|nr:TraB/GumN family protein [Paludibacter sp.]
MKNKLSFIILLAFVCVMQLNAQILWKVTGNGLKNPSYLFGTHHLIDSEKVPALQKALTFVNEVDAVVNEIDMSDMMGMQMKIMKGAMMKGQNIRDLISEEDYKLLDTEFKELLGIGLDKLGSFKPAMLSNLYSVSVYTKNKKISKEPEALDLIIQKAGKKAKKDIVELETADEQIEVLFNSLTLEKQAEILVKSVKEKEKGIEQMQKLDEAYLAGDLKKMEELYSEDEDMTEEYKKALVDTRNLKWVSKLNKLFETKSGVVAVGCLHLVGETGLIKQLEKNGFSVEPVKL